MWSSSNFGEFVPIWDFHPLLVWLFVFIIDFGMVMSITAFKDREIYFGRWWSFRIGDTVGLPALAGFGAVVVSSGDFHGFYTQWPWHVGMLFLGVFLSFRLNYNNLKSGQYTWKDVKHPAEIYHSIVMVFMVYFLGTLMTAMLFDGDPLWATIVAYLGFGVWFACVLFDMFLTERGTGRRSPNEMVITLGRKRG